MGTMKKLLFVAALASLPSGGQAAKVCQVPHFDAQGEVIGQGELILTKGAQYWT